MRSRIRSQLPEPGYGSELFDLLRSMALPAGQYAVFGSGPLLAKGIIDSVTDLDVICLGPAWEHACGFGDLVPVEGTDVMIVSTHEGAITFGRSWAYGSVDLADLIATAEMIDGLPFVRMEHVVEYKTIAGRPKDLAHLALIERHRTAPPEQSA